MNCINVVGANLYVRPYNKNLKSNNFTSTIAHKIVISKE